jgi:hypothetical protein
MYRKECVMNVEKNKNKENLNLYGQGMRGKILGPKRVIRRPSSLTTVAQKYILSIHYLVETISQGLRVIHQPTHANSCGT